MLAEIAPKALVLALLGTAIAACSSDPNPKPVATTLVGPGPGPAMSSAAGAAGGSRVAPAAIGGMIGSRIGAALDDEDKRRAYAAQVQALDGGPSGAPVAWRNPDSGRYGSVVPGTRYQTNGLECRQFTHTIYIDGKPQTARGAACRNPDGTWQAA
jgi:surface antigen